MHFLVALNCLFALRMTGTPLQKVPLVIKLASSKKPCCQLLPKVYFKQSRLGGGLGPKLGSLPTLQ